MKPFFSDKGLQTNKIILKDKIRLVTDSSIIAKTFNSYFTNITNTLDLNLLCTDLNHCPIYQNYTKTILVS